MTILKTPARQLKPGDLVVDPLPGTERAVVLCVALADPGPVGVQLGRVGPLPEHLARVATVSWHPDYVADVERLDLTAAQALADELLAVARGVARGVLPHPDTARALVDRIDPPAPTVEEVLELLADLHQRGMRPSDSAQADTLLERARGAGLLPRT